MATPRWTPAAIPAQNGKLAYITGANSGIGYHAALELARAGCAVILACRDRSKADAARTRILAKVPSAELDIAGLDLASLGSVRSAAESFLATGQRLDLLINYAGVMALPTRRTTPDGFELQLGTNHFGHFALTGLLLPALLRNPGSASQARIVTVSSIAHRGATMDFANLQWERGYKPWPAYRRTKLANLLFGFELQRRLDRAFAAAPAPAISIVVHPGVSNTNLFASGPGQSGGLLAKIVPPIFALIAQSDAQGSWPTLYGATSPEARGGRFYGPDGFREMRGYPIEIRAEAQAYDEKLAAKLWETSEQLTGVPFPLR
ncbi:MAG TPA: oxidoreductase [Acidobacteriaceae bacterium]|jgi:NAD(P)-dependent dehydrogenase (short-subunit alcohol dehydrogenase family)|nr:oxidoreductase [Acidobacteriaceae bacterium]